MDGELKVKLEQSLAPVFGSPNPLFVTDSPDLVTWLRAHNLGAYLLDDVAGLPKHRRKNVVLLPTTRDGLSFFRLERFFKGSRVLIVPLVAFDPSLEASIYSLNLLASSDFTHATNENARWVSILEEGEVQRLVFKGAYGELEVTLKERLDLMLPRTQVGLLPGEWEAIGMFFEIAMIPDNEDFFHPGYIVNGEVEIPGVAIAHHRIMPNQLTHLPTRAWQLPEGLIKEGRFPLKIKIENSQLKEVRSADGADFTDEIGELSNPQLELILVEMAVSNNPGLDVSNLDWSVNSVLNEGARGIHFAVGDGVTGAHIDFICPSMEAVLT
ncbi:hypothetical protein [Calidithermus roseus]|uniref:Crocagin biosynthetic protein CgnE/B domain-containing protein n=1 Tax=Calidithermus roseus TaxID=1644118 RepID=A0A399EJS7_9DEIN|nr:hypothetical protein [Calidithermus roseus]RIH83339.1 hypothetical protein Mrose_03078 [Calidithermus roseus]